jgi:DNA transposition AAA+ family ATPase
VTTSGDDIEFIETKQYQRFQEFCDACRKYQYIGLCYGLPGVGKTVSAHYYINPGPVASVMHHPPSEGIVETGMTNKAVLYTPSIVNSPGQIARDIGWCRRHFTTSLLNQLYRAERPGLKALERNMHNKRDEVYGNNATAVDDARAAEFRRDRDAYEADRKRYLSRRREIRDDPVLVVIDEADRLKMASLEQVRAIFDQGAMGLVLIGMPGLEKRLARYPQLYSRVGFVHEFKPLAQADVRQLLRDGWGSLDRSLPREALIDEETLAMLIRISEGRFRELYRLLQQISRVMEINRLDKATREVVEAARENLVIGTA